MKLQTKIFFVVLLFVMIVLLYFLNSHPVDRVQVPNTLEEIQDLEGKNIQKIPTH